MEPMKIKSAKLMKAVTLHQFGDSLSFKQYEMEADMDHMVLLIEAKHDGKRSVIPFNNIAIMEVLDEAEAEANRLAEEKAAKEREAALAKKAAARAAALAKPAPTGTVRYVKDADGNIVEG